MPAMAEQPVRPSENSPADNPWLALRRHAVARIGLGRTGVSIPTPHQLRFQLAHAEARDAVYSELNMPEMVQQLETLRLDTLALDSAARDRVSYMKRPDLGRRLSAASADQLTRFAAGGPPSYDVVFIVADGLSASAVQRHAAPTLAAVLAKLRLDQWRIAPIMLVRQGRVAISDDIGARLGAELAVILLGERPGLSAPDSLGIYLTFDPRPGTTDAHRNCISNIHAAGQSYGQAADTLVYLMREARRRQASGITLKDERALDNEQSLDELDSRSEANTRSEPVEL
jgi:ethanolamine ammonia-lyase small subunit